MNSIVPIDGKEAVPVRAIPFVTGWMMSPDMVAKALAHTDHWITRLKDVTAYHITADGEHAPMLPKEWDGIEAELQILSEKLKANETIDQENYPQWRRESISLLPSGCFVWKDEFEEAFSRSYSPQKLILMDERLGDRELNFSPRIPAELMDIVMEGFVPKAIDENLNDQGIDDAKPETIGRRERQHEVILAVIAALDFDPMKIPDGGKAKIKAACLTRPRLFTSDSFDHAWKAGGSDGLFRLANHQKYSPR